MDPVINGFPMDDHSSFLVILKKKRKGKALLASVANCSLEITVENAAIDRMFLLVAQALR